MSYIHAMRLLMWQVVVISQKWSVEVLELG